MTPAENSSAWAARWTAPPGSTPVPRWLALAVVTTFVALAIAFGVAAAHAAATDQPLVELRLDELAGRQPQ